MAPILREIDVSGMEVVRNERDFRRDLHQFVHYVRGRTIKRTYYGNEVPLVDRQRLARLLGLEAPGGEQRGRADFTSRWIAELDDLAYRLEVIHYKSEGPHAEYSSRSFSDNYIEFREPAWIAFAQRTPAEQETEIVRHRLAGEPIEFYRGGSLSRLDRFSTSGSALGAVPCIRFPEVRAFLLGVLVRLPAGKWIEMSSLVAYVKQHHEYCVIPSNPRGPRPSSVWGRPTGPERRSSEPELGPFVCRYGNFHEGGDDGSWRSQVVVPDDAPDGFERVEGRYLERFLEGVPLSLGLVDVAYGSSPHPEDRPSRGVLQAFRVNERLRLLLQGRVPDPVVTVQPDFQVIVESPLYPLRIIHQLEPLGEVKAAGPITTVRLRQERVMAARAADPTLDPLALLQGLVSRPIPSNVLSELIEWTEKGDAFTIYDGFGILECDHDVPAAMALREVPIAAGVHLVRNPNAVFDAIEHAERNPMRVRHPDDRIHLLPAHAKSVFPRESAGPGGKIRGSGKAARTEKVTKAPPAPVEIARSIEVTLTFPEPKLLEKVSHLLLEARCPVDVDLKGLTLCYAGEQEAQVTAVLEELAKTHPTRMVGAGR